MKTYFLYFLFPFFLKKKKKKKKAARFARGARKRFLTPKRGNGAPQGTHSGAFGMGLGRRSGQNWVLEQGRWAPGRAGENGLCWIFRFRAWNSMEFGIRINLDYGI